MRPKVLLALAAAAACALPAHARERVREYDRRGHHGLEGLSDLAGCLKKSPKTFTIEGRAVSLHVTQALPHMGPATVLFARADDGREVFAVAAERNKKLSKSEWAILNNTEFDDVVNLRGRGMERNGQLSIVLDDIKHVSTTRNRRPKLGTLEDVLTGPMPLPATLDLGNGRRLHARILGKQGRNLRIRASLAEITVPISEIKTATRTGCGSTCRSKEGRLDFLSALPLGGQAGRTFASSAAQVKVSRETGAIVEGAVLRGVRAGPKMGLIVRTKQHGDLLVFLPSKTNRPGEATEAARRLLVRALSLKRGSEVRLAVNRTFEGLVLGGGYAALRVKMRDAWTVPGVADDPDASHLDKAKRASLQKLIAMIEDDGVDILAQAVARLDKASQRVALRALARQTDAGDNRAPTVLRAIIDNVPPDQWPNEVAGALIRAIFMYRSDSTRVQCAEILGRLGCREGITALEEASHLYPSTDFARAASAAVRRIRRAPPR